MIEVAVKAIRGDFTVNAAFISSAGTSHGGVIALIGPSGAGKSTVIAMIAGLVRPATGRITLNDRVLFDSDAQVHIKPHLRRIAVVFQDGLLFPHLNVKQNLLYGMWFNKDRSASLPEVMELLNLEPLLEREPMTLSGGEKQRVSLGRALLSSPELLLMDEPLSNLDPRRRAEILPYLERLRDQKNIPMVYVSHTVEEVVRLADQVVVLDHGRTIADGAVESVLNNADLWPIFGEQDAGSILAARIVRHDPDQALTDLVVGDEKLVIPLISGAVGGAVRLRVLARDVAVATKKPSNISIRNVLSGVVAGITLDHNSSAEVKIAAAGTVILARITQASVKDLNLTIGRPVYALLKAVAMDRLM